jgi:hypothetical protein
MSCTQSSTLHEVIPTADMTTSLLDLDIETTCSLTKSLYFDSVEPPAISSSTSNMSDISSLQSAECYGALSSNDTSTNHTFSAGSRSEMQGLGSLPINSWRQASATAIVTPGHASLRYPLANGVSYSNHSGNHVSHRSIGLEQPEPAVWPSNAISVSPAVGGVNASSCIPYHHLNSCYAYALDRGNGQYTQLIPADCLPALVGLPSLQGPEGLIILSQPRGPVPSNVRYDIAPSVIGTGRPSSRSSDAVQSTIDNIVANLPSAPKKREKVYCDKWLHEGVCAFAQQGCRYKHDMPMDKATQHAVGLFNGLPKWYKEKYTVELRGKSPPALSTLSQASPLGGRNALLNSGSWRGGHGGRGSMLHMQSSSPAPRSGKQPQGKWINGFK